MELKFGLAVAAAAAKGFAGEAKLEEPNGSDDEGEEEEVEAGGGK